MSEVFLSVLNMSISASWIVLAVLLLRVLLKKAPKWITVLLWAVVAVRLVCPFTIESVLSLIPSAQTVPSAIMTDSVPQIYSGISAVNNMVNPVIGETFSPAPGDSANPLQIWIPVVSAVWGIGILALLAYGSLSFIRVKRRVLTAVRLRDNIYQSENVASPFVLGMIRPKIYLPFAMPDGELSHVIAHEEAHICRKDHWWKPIGFGILSLHWFNPLMWLAYVLLCRDIELACDEKVVKDLSLEERAEYSQALLNCSVGRRMIVFCPLAFGEVSVKDRVKSVLSYKKPAFWVLLVGIVASLVLAVCFLTNPASGELGSLENLEFISVSERTETTACVWVSDGFGYNRIGAVSKDLLQDLASLKTSKEEISLDRSEDRDKSHTLVLQTAKQAAPSALSYLEGLYIHFNSDFTAVWINNGVKPTLSYKVIEPKRAKEVFERIARSGDSSVDTEFTPIVVPDNSIDALKERYPMYFDLSTFKGLEVYIWQMAENSYSCGLLPGVNRNYAQEEIWALHFNSTTLEEMQYIIANYIASGEVSRDSVTICPVVMPHSSYAYEIDADYRAEVRRLFWDNLPHIENPIASRRSYALFDIDGDQTVEECYISGGPTSGIFSFSIRVYEGGDLEYFNIFVAYGYISLYFETNVDGETILVGKENDRTRYMTLGVDNGNVVILSDGDGIGYWSEGQGVDSPYVGLLFLDGPFKAFYGNLKTYYLNRDGTWQCEGYQYKYRLVITGRQPLAVADTTYVYLSNIENISFERAMWASGLSSRLADYFSLEDAVLVEIETEGNEAPTEYQANVEIFQNDDRTYSYTVSDQKGNILYRQENAIRKPKVWEVSSDVFGLVTQTGTGLATNWAVFCDVESGRVSEIFSYVLGVQGDCVVYADRKEEKYFVVVQNVFDKSAYCKTYELDNVSPVAADFVVECEFDGDGNATVTYLVSKKNTRTKLTINIP